MSLYPNSVDSIPRLTDLAPLDSGETPADVITRLYDGIAAVESHTGFSLISGGDTRTDGTAVPASPTRVLASLRGIWVVTPEQAGQTSILVPLAEVFSETRLLNANPVPAGSSVGLSPLSGTQSPCYLVASRRLLMQPAMSSIVCLPDGTASGAITAVSLIPEFLLGEILDLRLLFLGGA